MAMEATTAMMTEMTTVEAAEDLFDFTAMWISMGVLGFFVLLVVGYGIFIAQTGRLHLPQMLEDKEPLTSPHREDDVEADTKKAPPSGKTDNSGGEETENATAVEEEPPSYDQVARGGASCRQEAATNTADCDADGGNVSVEVYEQKVDTTDENHESTYL